jgi:glycosyltransferase involved in cell wall biosynthesis
MKILFFSYGFWPKIGGIEEVSRTLALEFHRRGHEICLVTHAPSDQQGDFPFEIVRRPGRRQLAARARWSDVVFQNNISLRYAWPLMFVRRPWVIAHHSFIQQSSGRPAIQDFVKRFLLRFGANIAVSEAIAQDIRVPCVVAGNPYRANVFRLYPEVARAKQLGFVGRLVTQKGVDVLIEALAILRARNVTPSLTIFGDGPARADLEALVRGRSLSNQVQFAGVVMDDALARALNEIQIVVAPSVGLESFGLVAIEAIACGCAVVASDIGGLKEAVGPCGWTVPPRDAQALADQLQAALSDTAQISEKRSHAEAHLARFTVDAVATKYLDVLAKAAGKSV